MSNYLGVIATTAAATKVNIYTINVNADVELIIDIVRLVLSFA